MDSGPEPANLMLVELPKTLGRQVLLLKKLEHRRPSIVTREVIRRPREPRRTRPHSAQAFCGLAARGALKVESPGRTWGSQP
jgi:hypothetical protein